MHKFIQLLFKLAGPVMISLCLPVTSARAADRCVMVEYFTNARCVPCTVTTAVLDSLTEEYPDSQVAIIRCHGDATSPFFRLASGSRKDYYYSWPWTIPRSYFDGVIRITGSDSAYQRYTNSIEARLAVPSPLSISLSAVYDSLTGGGQIIAQVEAVDQVGGQDLRLRYALIESGLVFEGKQYSEVLVDLFPGAEGVSFEIESGQVFHDTVDFDLDELWIPEDCSEIGILEIACVAWVQDDDSKEVHQSVQIPLDLPPASPVMVTGLATAVAGPYMYLTWTPVTLDIYCRPISVDDYQIYRCIDLYYDPGAAVLLDSTAASSYLDSTCACVKDLLENGFYYLIARRDGKVSEPSGAVGEIDHYIFKGK